MLLGLGIVALLSGSSCGKQAESGVIWGETEFFSDFLMKKYEPVRMTQTLEFEFNEYARDMLSGAALEFEIVEQTDGAAVPAQDILVYKNGELCPDNLLVVGVGEEEAELSIEFLPEARPGYHKLFLREKSLNGLDRIDYMELGDGIYVQKRDVVNPLKFIVLLALSILAAAAVTLIAVSHLVLNPHLRFSYVDVDYHDGCGERRIRMKGSYKLVFTNESRRVSFLRKLFIGSIAFEQNEFWTGDLTVKCKSGSYLRLTGTSNYTFDTDDFVRKEPIVITNANGRKATVTTA